VRLGANHGYLIDGDVARIHADVLVHDARPTDGLTLQLWACEAPHAGGPLSGVIVAEAEVGGVVAAALPHQRLVAEANARVPGGRRDYAMVLVLASSEDGDRQVHDFANYPERQRFVTPYLDGRVGYHVDGDQVLITAAAIGSPRDADNLSGSLGLELRAVPFADVAERHEGHLLARVDLGRLHGQGALSNIAERVPFASPPVGRWKMMLTLREWAGAAGDVTRDHAVFAVPYVVEGAAASATGVSVNHASIAELSTVKGMSKAVAREIVKGRPFQSIEALLDVRGIGPKLLARLRPHLTL
jgi:hypothetical protein